MNKQIKVILLAVAMIAVIILAGVLYTKYSKNYAPNDNVTGNSSASQVVADDFTVTDKDGNEVSLSDFKGKPVIVNFWASWCGPCKSEMSDFNDAYVKYGEDIAFMMVNMTDGSRETLDTASKYITEAGYAFPVYYDTVSQNAAVTYGITSIPSTLFIDKDGNIVTATRGAMRADVLAEYITKLQS